MEHVVYMVKESLVSLSLHALQALEVLGRQWGITCAVAVAQAGLENVGGKALGLLGPSWKGLT